MNAAPITDNPIYLDAADEWLLANDPTLAGLAPKTLFNRRRREHHRVGGVLWDEEGIEELDSPDSLKPTNKPDFEDLTRIARYRAERQLLASLANCPSLAAAARTLGVSRQAAHKTFSRLLKRAKAKHAASQAMARWDSLPPSPPIPLGIGQQMDLFGGEL